MLDKIVEVEEEDKKSERTEDLRNIDLIFSDDPTNLYDYFNSCCANLHLESERKLWLTVLMESFTDYQAQPLDTNLKKSRFQEAFDWFFNEEDSEWPGSFSNICDIFNFNASYIRKQLILWTKLHYKVTSTPIIVKGPNTPFYVPIAPLMSSEYKLFPNY